jgi:O-antigen biosynthesis protein
VDISVIIVNYNVKEFLRGALKSVFHALDSGKLSGEVFVVDNNSEDDSVKMVLEEFPDVILHALPENIGFGRANNIALREAKGDYLLILNPDTILAEDTLRKMVDFMRARPDVGMSGCKLLNGDGSFQLSCRRGFPTPWASFTKLFGLSKLFPNSKLFAQYNLTYLPVNETYEVDALGGAFMLLSREGFTRTQGFDEDYFMYGEDLDLCFRVKAAGLKVFYAPITATIHFKGESTKRSALNEVKVFYEAMHIFIKKNYGSSFVFSSLLRLGIFFRTVVALGVKHKGAALCIVLDLLAVVFGVLAGTEIITGRLLGLPAQNYPWALIVPPLVLVTALSMIKAYTPENRRSAKPLIAGTVVSLVALSSLTYFFKEFPASRSLVIVVTAMSMLAMIATRMLLRFADRLRFGGVNSAKPVLRRTLIVGTDGEAQRIAGLLTRSEFMMRYKVLGFVGSDLTSVGQPVISGLSVLATPSTLPRFIREQKITEVIFASNALPYSEMLRVMQQVSDLNPSMIVNFNVVPSATDVILGRRKIEMLAEEPNSVIGLIPLEYNVQRISHRLTKRVIDLVLSALALPFVAVHAAITKDESARETVTNLNRVLRGDLSLVGVAAKSRTAPLSKAGLTSLASITLPDPSGAREEDIEQLDLYYAKHHTLGMDLEILLRSLFLRRTR